MEKQLQYFRSYVVPVRNDLGIHVVQQQGSPGHAVFPVMQAGLGIECMGDGDSAVAVCVDDFPVGGTAVADGNQDIVVGTEAGEVIIEVILRRQGDDADEVVGRPLPDSELRDIRGGNEFFRLGPGILRIQERAFQVDAKNSSAFVNAPAHFGNAFQGFGHPARFICHDRRHERSDTFRGQGGSPPAQPVSFGVIAVIAIAAMTVNINKTRQDHAVAVVFMAVFLVIGIDRPDLPAADFQLGRGEAFTDPYPGTLNTHEILPFSFHNCSIDLSFTDAELYCYNLKRKQGGL